MPPLLRPVILLLSIWLSGCATVEGPKHPDDPLEGYNRAMYEFNDDFDRSLFRPLAEGYDRVMPRPAKTGVRNFFSNLDDVVVLFNDILQLKLRQGLSDLGRITWNSTVGLFGLIDVATPMGLPKHNEDFGQTLGHWGVGSGPYLVLPFLGPSTIRDGTGMVVDWQYDPLDEVKSDDTRWALIGLKAVDTRAGLLQASRMLESASLDPYSFMRDSYLQRRNNLVHDGNPPVTEEEFDPFAEEEFDPFAEEPPAPEQP